MKLYLMATLTLFITYTGKAQLGLTEKKIIEKQGIYFKKDIEQQSILLLYKSKIIDDFGQSLPEIILYKIDKANQKCFLEVYTSSKSGINSYIKLLNKMAVKVTDNRWEDYKNNSKYTLKTEENIVSIEHSYIYSELQNLKTPELKEELNNCQKENHNLVSEIDKLKIRNKELVQNMDYATVLTENGATNIEKALQSIKEKDKKIRLLQDMITKKDSLFLDYINKQKIKRRITK